MIEHKHACIEDRVAHVPIQDIKRRFDRSMGKFFKEYRLLADKWILFNNAEQKPKIIAKKQNALIEIINQGLFEKIIKKVGVDL